MYAVFSSFHLGAPKRLSKVVNKKVKNRILSTDGGCLITGVCLRQPVKESLFYNELIVKYWTNKQKLTLEQDLKGIIYYLFQQLIQDFMPNTKCIFFERRTENTV